MLHTQLSTPMQEESRAQNTIPHVKKRSNLTPTCCLYSVVPMHAIPFILQHQISTCIIMNEKKNKKNHLQLSPPHPPYKHDSPWAVYT